MHLVRVALDVPLPTLFDYRLEHTRRELIGARVLVPFGRGQRAGIILEVGGEPEVPPERIKRVAHVFADEAPLAPDVLQLMRFASRYYHHPIGQVVMGALPQALRRAHASRDASGARCVDRCCAGSRLVHASCPCLGEAPRAGAFARSWPVHARASALTRFNCAARIAGSDGGWLGRV